MSAEPGKGKVQCTQLMANVEFHPLHKILVSNRKQHWSPCGSTVERAHLLNSGYAKNLMRQHTSLYSQFFYKKHVSLEIICTSKVLLLEKFKAAVFREASDWLQAAC